MVSGKEKLLEREETREKWEQNEKRKIKKYNFYKEGKIDFMKGIMQTVLNPNTKRQQKLKNKFTWKSWTAKIEEYIHLKKKRTKSNKKIERKVNKKGNR